MTAYSWEPWASGDVSSTRELGEQDHLGPGGATRARLSTDWVEAQRSRGSFHRLLEIQTERGRGILTREMTWGKSQRDRATGSRGPRTDLQEWPHFRSRKWKNKTRARTLGPQGQRTQERGGCFGLSHPSETSGSVRTEEEAIGLGN